MSHLEVVLAARAHGEARAVRSAVLRHRRLASRPIGIVLWRLGAEQFSASAIGYGNPANDMRLLVAGDPRNRDLQFGMLMEFARWFNRRFEKPAEKRDTIQRGQTTYTIAKAIPQIVVPNNATIDALGRLGRRLAFLNTSGDQPADPELVTLGRHLLFIGRHADEPGQQLIVSVTDLLASHWITPQSDVERLSLPALDAFIDPLKVVNGFDAAAIAELDPAGPEPIGDIDTDLQPLIAAFTEGRGGMSNRAKVRPLLVKIESFYRDLAQRTWDIMWRSVDREREWPEAPSVTRRWDADRDAYTRHIDWTAQDGRRRTRETARQAAMTMRRLETASALLAAEEAIDDPLRMIPYLLDQKAVQGRVAEIDDEHREVVNGRRLRRPILTLDTDDPCLVLAGTELHWTGDPAGPAWVVASVRPRRRGSRVTLQLPTGAAHPMPGVRSRACFSVLTTKAPWSQRLSHQVPWPHWPDAPPATPASIEESA